MAAADLDAVSMTSKNSLQKQQYAKVLQSAAATLGARKMKSARILKRLVWQNKKDISILFALPYSIFMFSPKHTDYRWLRRNIH
jgi:hypothetical protein